MFRIGLHHGERIIDYCEEHAHHGDVDYADEQEEEDWPKYRLDVFHLVEVEITQSESKECLCATRKRAIVGEVFAVEPVCQHAEGKEVYEENDGEVAEVLCCASDGVP